METAGTFLGGALVDYSYPGDTYAFWGGNPEEGERSETVRYEYEPRCIDGKRQRRKFRRTKLLVHDMAAVKLHGG